MIPTPDLSHLTRVDYEHVYEPAEDTFILLDALEQDAAELQSSRPLICLEIGSGSGCVSAFLAKILGSKACLFLCTDINSYASRCTLDTGHQNRAALQPVVASLADPFLERLGHNVDVLLFNPPYVPTVSQDWQSAQFGKSLEGAWAGGTDGMQLTNELLMNVNHLLSPRGRFYLVALKANGIENIQQRMLAFGFASKICLQRRAGREHLFVIRFQRMP
ncbi:S-adenosyl-L-methionine-dependent methyltransferase [Gautieria morchelliformis]|nr:S-adenosyl-L-methionine-dependent methyltransferase [Gautieria morchelliformis]